MKKVLACSCGIGAAALGVIALSGKPLAISGPAAGVGVAANQSAGDGTRSGMAAARMAQAVAPAGQAAPSAAEPGKPPADVPNAQAAPPNQSNQAAPPDQQRQAAPPSQRGRAFFDDWDGPWDDADDRPGEIDDDDWGRRSGRH
jgi:hypothetical protein